MKKVSNRQIREIISKVKCTGDCACSEAGNNQQCLSGFTTITAFPGFTKLPCRQQGEKPCKMLAILDDGIFCRCPVRVNIIRRINNLASIVPSQNNNKGRESNDSSKSDFENSP